MNCFSCGNATLLPGEVEITGERYGQQFTVRMMGLRCLDCGFQTIDPDQGSELTRLVSDAYRSANGLLTSAEIVAARAQMGMSQQEFADYIGPGVASVKRWEAGKIQDRAMDQLIRLKTDPQVARRNLKAVESHVPEQYVLSTIAMGDQDIELSFLWDHRQYEPKPQIRMDRSDWSVLSDIGGELAA